jgi:UDP-hydrolysing UDP-N-acetyl-D-glucosamine 2-epimerase
MGNITKKKRKICVVVFSRANYGRIKAVLREINNHPDLELLLVVGASALLWRFGDITDIIKKDGFEVKETVYSIVEGEKPVTMAKSTGMGIIELATIFENLKPDIVLTVADRFETVATAIAASYMNIPVAHTQGGEVTGSIDESVRHAITKFSHIHFPATEKAADRIIKMGEDPTSVFMTGCPSIDLLKDLDSELSGNVFSKYDVAIDDLNPSQPFLLCLQHPVTTEYSSGLFQINETLKAVTNIKMPAVWLWPNADAGSDDIAKGLRIFKEEYKNSNIHFFLNFTPEDYANTLLKTKCIIGNSSSSIREGSFLGSPAVNIGSRQNGRERGRNVIDVNYCAEEIENAIRKQLSNGCYEPDHLYGDGNAAVRIASTLAEVEIKIQKRLAY